MVLLPILMVVVHVFLTGNGRKMPPLHGLVENDFKSMDGDIKIPFHVLVSLKGGNQFPVPL